MVQIDEDTATVPEILREISRQIFYGEVDQWASETLDRIARELEQKEG
jgi:hypothetical protein